MSGYALEIITNYPPVLSIPAGVRRLFTSVYALLSHTANIPLRSSAAHTSYLYCESKLLLLLLQSGQGKNYCTAVFDVGANRNLGPQSSLWIVGQRWLGREARCNPSYGTERCPAASFPRVQPCNTTDRFSCCHRSGPFTGGRV